MNIWQAIVLGVVEGVTEFLPVSSTGHLTITEKVVGLNVDDPAVTGFTAVVQMGAIAAVIIFFAKDILGMIKAFFGGLASPAKRATHGFRFALAVVVGSIPIVLVGLAAKDLITGPLRSLWVVAGGLVVWSAVMVFSEWSATHRRDEGKVTVLDGLVLGLAQCLALVPGVSRSGAMIATGLLRDLDRVAATRFSFFVGIPALFGAGIYELKDALSGSSVGVFPLVVGTIVSFFVAYASIAWLLRFVAHHSLAWFAGYRVMLGGVIVVVLAANLLPAT